MPQLLTTAEAATLLAVSTRTLEGWRSKLVGPPYKKLSDNVVRYSAEDLEAWVDRSSQTGQP